MFLLLLFITLVSASRKELVTFDVAPPVENLLAVYKTRCSRRFSPGNCLDPVRPVWTFNFAQQNCTERLGCADPLRVNRFSSYANCIRGCRIMIDLYLQIMATVDRSALTANHNILRNIPVKSPPRRALTPPELPPEPHYDYRAEEFVSRFLYDDGEIAENDRIPLDADNMAANYRAVAEDDWL